MLYIKINENGLPEGNLFTGENIKYLFNVADLTDDVLNEKGYARYERAQQPYLTVLSSNKGYIKREDGVWTDDVEFRELNQQERLDLFVRRHRDFLLAKSDWTQMPDSPLSAEEKAKWAAYRQELRDMTNKYPDPKVDDLIEYPRDPNALPINEGELPPIQPQNVPTL